ncbi:MAG: nitroreductase family protein, partial [Kiritimatiellales bacterium]|nr:nitroreductase family protein [Kiritimatiellales bacterium]
MDNNTHRSQQIDGPLFQKLAERRRSTRIFKEDPVPDDTIRRIVRAATLAPTACNRQLWHMVVVTDPAVKERVSRLSHAEQSYVY